MLPALSVTHLSCGHAFGASQTDIVLKLLTFPVIDVEAKNTAGSTALDIANKLELFEIAAYLEDYALERDRKLIKFGPTGDGPR